MLTDENCRRCARGLLDAMRTGRPAASPSVAHPGLSIGDAYRIQRSWRAARLEEGARLAGYKIGLTSPATQRLFQATGPMYGAIFDDCVLAEGTRVRAAAFLAPRLEVELAFVLGADLAEPDPSIARVLQATERVVPAFEIIDQRTESPRPLADAIADNAAFGAIVLGRRGIAPDAVDPASIAATLERNGSAVQSGSAASVMGHPAAAVAWLASALHSAGEHLERGQVILTGTLTPAVAVSAGDVFRADYGELGAIGVSFD